MSLSLNNTCCFNYCICCPSIYLYANRSLVITYCKFARRSLYIAYQGLSSNKLRIYHSSPITLTKSPKTNIGDIFHRGQH